MGNVIYSGNGRLLYDPASKFEFLAVGESSTDSLIVTITDSSGNISSSMVTFTIIGVNDAPQSVNDSYSLNEGATINITIPSGLLLNDSDLEGDALTAQLITSVNYGSLSFNSDGSFSYTHDGSENYLDQFSYRAFDGNLTGSTANVTLTVKGLNDHPQNSLPGWQTITEDQTLTFSTANFNLISVNDTDLLGGNLRINLSANSGLLTLATTAGLHFSSGDGSTDQEMIFQGNLTNITSALDGLVYAPQANFWGLDSLRITCDDMGNSGIGGNLMDTDMVMITVNTQNDAPVLNNSVNSVFSVIDEGNTNNNGNRISQLLYVAGANIIYDVDPGAVQGIAITSLDNSLGEWQYSSNSGSSWVNIYSGNVSSSQALLLDSETLIRLIPIGDANGSSSISFRAWDQTDGNPSSFWPANASSGGNASSFSANIAVASITVNALNDHPVISFPSAPSVLEDTDTILNAITLSDVDSGNGNLQLSLTVQKGNITLASNANLIMITGDGIADNSISMRGLLSELNNALNGFIFRGDLNYSGTALSLIHI